MRLLASGEYGRAASGDDATTRDARLLVARDRDTFLATWRSNVNDDNPPELDFSREVAVFLLLGRHSSGGYAVEPLSADVEGDTLHVDARMTAPSKRAIVSMAFTAPYAVIAVPKGSFRRVDWRNEQRVLVREESSPAEARQ